MPDGVPAWTDWIATLEPLIRSVRVTVEVDISESAVLRNVGETQRAIDGVIEPRKYLGVVTVCPEVNRRCEVA